MTNTSASRLLSQPPIFSPFPTHPPTHLPTNILSHVTISLYSPILYPLTTAPSTFPSVSVYFFSPFFFFGFLSPCHLLIVHSPPPYTHPNFLHTCFPHHNHPLLFLSDHLRDFLFYSFPHSFFIFSHDLWVKKYHPHPYHHTNSPPTNFDFPPYFPIKCSHNIVLNALQKSTHLFYFFSFFVNNTKINIPISILVYSCIVGGISFGMDVSIQKV